jgi:DNA-binding CsgD family transcriptional regulator
MRVLLVGRPQDRARLRAELEEAGVEIAAESSTLIGRDDGVGDVDAVVIAPDAIDVHGHAVPREPDGTEMITVEPLTAREQEVLDILAEGLSNKAIARRLGISDQTVKFHVASICGKLGAANRTEAVRRAVRRGLITL